MTTSTAERKILLNAFDMNCAVHQSPGLWRHPQDRSRDYNTLDYWVDLAQTLEKGLFDGLFIADVLGTYDVYGRDNQAALTSGAQVPVNDPILLVSAMARATEHLGFGITAGTAYEHPYPFARRLATLDHLTNGRVGWNVVTGYLPSAAQNMGETDQLPHDERYDRADEYLEVIYKLLEGSWEEDATVHDVERGIYNDPEKVHPINHHGKYFDVPGIAITEPSTQRTPVIYQAGSSPRGLKFAGQHAEAVFINPNTIEQIKQTTAKIRRAAQEAGRDPYSVRVFSMRTVITGATEEEAQAKLEDYRQYIDPVGGLTLMSGWTGTDLSEYELDEPITNIESNAIRSTANAISNGSAGQPNTVRSLGESTGIGGFGPVSVGSGEAIARELAEIQDITDVDGFNLAYAVTPGSFQDIVDHVIPELQKIGRYKTKYAEGSLRNKLLGKGDRLSDEHFGARFRNGLGGERAEQGRQGALDGGAEGLRAVGSESHLAGAETLEVIQERLSPVFDEIARTAPQREKDRDFDRGLVDQLKKAGFTRLRVPKKYGGAGLSLVETFELLRQLAAADSNLAQALRPHFLAVEGLLAAEDSPHKEKWLRAVGSGEVAIGNALTEVGAAPGEYLTTLEPRAGGGYVLNGKKFYSTGSLYSDVIQVHGVGPSEEQPDGLAFISRDAPGVELLDDWDGFGQQLSASGTSIFTDVPVDDIDISWTDYTAPGIRQAWAQAHHLTTLAGISSAITRDISRYVRDRRRVFSHGSGDLPRHDPQVQHVVGEVAAKEYAVRAILNDLVRQLQEVTDRVGAHGASREELASVELATFKAQSVIASLTLEQANVAFEVGGASATNKDRGLDRHWRNARVLANHNPIIYRIRQVGDDQLNGGHEARQYLVSHQEAGQESKE